MKIYFIRHGETTGDIENRYGGTYDDHLSENGIDQAKELGQAFINKNIEIIFSSPLIRAQETAEILSQAVEKPIRTIEGFKERNQYGILSGMTKDEAKDKYPEVAEMVKDRMSTVEGAESYQDFVKRFTAAFQQIALDTSYQTVAIVGHGGGARAVYREILSLGELTQVGDCSYMELEHEDGKFSLVEIKGMV
jgi:broad specificity phosphatase PhoE